MHITRKIIPMIRIGDIFKSEGLNFSIQDLIFSTTKS